MTGSSARAVTASLTASSTRRRRFLGSFFGVKAERKEEHKAKHRTRGEDAAVAATKDAAAKDEGNDVRHKVAMAKVPAAKAAKGEDGADDRGVRHNFHHVAANVAELMSS